MGSHRSLVPVEKPEHIRDIHMTKMPKDFGENCQLEQQLKARWNPPGHLHANPQINFLYLWAELLGLDEANPPPYEA